MHENFQSATSGHATVSGWPAAGRRRRVRHLCTIRTAEEQRSGGMQPVGPYRFTEALGVCQVGTAWWAVDGHDRLVTVAVLDGAAATDQPWREAFANAANAMALTPGGQRYVNADFAAAKPWVAYPSEEGMGASRLFQTLGMDLQPAESEADVLVPETGSVAGPPEPVSGVPTSGTPSPISGAPLPWAMHAAVPHQVSSPPQQVSPAPQQVSPGPLSVYQPVSGPPQDPFAGTARRITPSAPPQRRTGLWIGIVALILVVLTGAGGAFAWVRSSGTDSAPPPYSLDERAVAIASPALVYVEVQFTGYLRDKETETPLRATPVTFNRRCSGFVVGSAGHVLTNGLCVQPASDTARQNALYALGRTLIGEKKLASAQLDNYVATHLKGTVLTGLDAGKEPEVRVFGQFNVARGNITDGPAIPGEIVKTWAPEMGDVALVKLAQDHLPVAELNPSADVRQGTSLLMIGYGTSDRDPLTATFTVASKPVTVTGAGSQGPVPVYRVNDDVGIYSRGGLAVDTSGRVVGMLDNDQALPDKANRVIVPASTLTTLLNEAGVTAELGDTDKLYRRGLDAYFAGRYSDAKTQLQTVATHAPKNLVAQTYRQNAVDRQKIERKGSSFPSWAVVLFAALGGALIVTLVVLVFMARGRDRH
ncbi:trypsin-like peptidase domain-containing protein [Micromonospora yasonensis]|uniref:S1 family peptidase n=1 Tax=Micromonospora yasonensis TaxID=1128667 RepID=UPI00222F783C|nr:trypsin-like peptidase domain-containing protein [Micromonospora yasonensis]MCW3840042.1 trypsin-like peptidase domain-containing protein [Micromonospora yasonensis]